MAKEKHEEDITHTKNAINIVMSTAHSRIIKAGPSFASQL